MALKSTKRSPCCRLRSSRGLPQRVSAADVINSLCRNRKARTVRQILAKLRKLHLQSDGPPFRVPADLELAVGRGQGVARRAEQIVADHLAARLEPGSRERARVRHARQPDAGVGPRGVNPFRAMSRVAITCPVKERSSTRAVRARGGVHPVVNHGSIRYGADLSVTIVRLHTSLRPSAGSRRRFLRPLLADCLIKHGGLAQAFCRDLRRVGKGNRAGSEVPHNQRAE